MLDTLANNPTAFCLGAALFLAIWVSAGRITNAKARISIRSSAAFLVFPVAYLGHPILFGSVWMLVVAGIVTPAPLPLAIVLAAWFGVVAICRYFYRGKNEHRETRG